MRRLLILITGLVHLTLVTGFEILKPPPTSSLREIKSPFTTPNSLYSSVRVNFKRKSNRLILALQSGGGDNGLGGDNNNDDGGDEGDDLRWEEERSDDCSSRTSLGFSSPSAHLYPPP